MRVHSKNGIALRIPEFDRGYRASNDETEREHAADRQAQIERLPQPALTVLRCEITPLAERQRTENQFAGPHRLNARSDHHIHAERKVARDRLSGFSHSLERI